VPGGPARAAREMRATRVTCYHLDARIRRRGASWLGARLRPPDRGAIDGLRAGGRGLLLVAWHAGVVGAIAPALARVGVEALVLLHARRPEASPGIEQVELRAADGSAAALKRAVDRLRAGGVVVYAVDVPWEDRETAIGPFPLLGRAAPLKPGASLMARLGRAAVAPVTARWTGRTVEVDVHAPIVGTAPPDCAAGADRAVDGAVCVFWDGYLRAHPGELWVESLRAIARAPKL